MYEIQNKSIIKHLAKSDLKSKKMGNLFIMVTIVIAVILIMVMGLSQSSIKVDMQRKLANAQDVMYMEVTKGQIKALEQDDRFSYLTVGKMGEQIEIDDYLLWHVYYDGSSDTIKTMELTEGELPEKKNEVLVPKGYLKKIGKAAKVGTKISVPFLSGKQEMYVVSGFTKDVKNSNVYSVIHSKAYAETGTGLKDINYNVLAKVKDASKMTQNEFLETIRDAAEKAGISRSQVNENDNYLFTLPEGRITTETVSIAVIGLIIFIAAIMVIYSVFYISITGKTREYGQLRTLGMTKKQVRRMVRREGILLALRALPIGLVLGGFLSFLSRPGGFSITNTLLMAVIAIATTLVTVMVSVMKPAKIAASISPMEAARYSAYNGDEGKKQTRKLQRKITPFSLARMNSSRNRKKTFVTMLSLGIGGVLFIGAVTFAVSLDKEKFARQGPYEIGEFVLSFSGNAVETAEHGAAELQLKNPFTKKLYDEIQAVPGVKKIYDLQCAHIKYDYKDQAGAEDIVTPFTKQEAADMEEALTEGSFDYEGLLSGDKILVRGNNQAQEIFGWKFEVGDKVTLHYYDGKESFKTYEIAGIVENYKDGLTDGWFLLPEQVLKKELPAVNLSNQWVIATDLSMTDEAEPSLTQMADQNPKLSIDTLRQRKAQSEEEANQFVLMVVVLVLFLVLFSLINLINTLISNFMSQKTELAMLQSIGMTGSQISKLVIGEGLVLAAGNILISLVFGYLLRYGACWVMANSGVQYVV